MKVLNIETKMMELNQKLLSDKIFLNMVVHDMRNPASSIDFGLQQSLEIIKKFENQIKNLETEMVVDRGPPEQVALVEERNLSYYDFDENDDENEVANIPMGSC